MSFRNGPAGMVGSDSVESLWMTGNADSLALSQQLNVSKDQLRLLLQKAPFLSCLKVALYFAAIISVSLLYLSFQSRTVAALAICVMGVVFAHGLELQHEALHGNLFRRRGLNRFCGLLLGAPMLVSFTHYRSYHFHHHRSVGTRNDEELFNYSITSLRDPLSFVARAWNVDRVPRFFRTIAEMLWNRYPDKVRKADYGRLLSEYIVLGFGFCVGIGSIMLLGESSLLVLWILPWLLVAEPVHFLIELPEHLGCDRSTRSILENTRSYESHPAWHYLTNYNNYHIEHHLFPAIPAHRLKKLHEHIVNARGHCSAGYWSALREVFSVAHQQPELS